MSYYIRTNYNNIIFELYYYIIIINVIYILKMLQITYDCKMLNCGRKFNTDEDLKNHLKRRHTDQKTSTKELLKPIQYKKTFTETHSILSSHNSLQESTDNNNLSTTGIDDTFSKTTSTFGFSSSTGFKKEINIITKELLGIGTKYEFEDNIREVRVNINICR